jgi:uncharacterized protein (TIGR02284 family)
MTPQPPISCLNEAIEVCLNGQEGFAQAASAVRDAHLRKMLGEYSEQRAQFALQLQSYVKRLGAQPQTHGSVGGALHRSWIGLKSAITGGSESAILDECARGDDTALETYGKALHHDLAPEAHDLLASQRRQIEEVRGQISELRAHLQARPLAGQE